jgi:hypothetical protein
MPETSKYMLVSRLKVDRSSPNEQTAVIHTLQLLPGSTASVRMADFGIVPETQSPTTTRSSASPRHRPTSFRPIQTCTTGALTATERLLFQTINSGKPRASHDLMLFPKPVFVRSGLRGVLKILPAGGC